MGGSFFHIYGDTPPVYENIAGCQEESAGRLAAGSEGANPPQLRDKEHPQR